MKGWFTPKNLLLTCAAKFFCMGVQEPEAPERESANKKGVLGWLQTKRGERDEAIKKNQRFLKAKGKTQKFLDPPF